jgi:O-antigen/teichoic acid export membrane protein
MKAQIATSVFWMAWLRGIVQAASLVSTLVVARLLTPADYGLIALAGIWVNTLALVTELGVGAVIVQFPDLEERELNACFALSMGAAGLGYVALYASAPALAAWFATPALSDVLRVAGLSVPLGMARIVPDGLLRKRLELDKVAQAEVGAALVGIPVVLGLALLGAGVWALVAGFLAMSVVQGLVSFSFVRWRPGLGMGSTRLRDILAYGVTTLGGGVCWGLYDQVDTFVLGKMSGNAGLGFYSMAKTLANLPVMKVAVAVKQLAGPLMAELQGNRMAMGAFFLRELGLVACFTTPLCVGTALVARDLVRIALGDTWLPMVPMLQILSVSAALHSIVTCTCPPVLSARYRAGFLFRWNGGLLLVMPLAFWAGAAWNGGLGLALACLLIYPFMMAGIVREALKELDLTWRSAWEQLRPVAGATGGMVAGALAVGVIVPDALHPIARVVLIAGSGLLAYGCVLFWCGRALVSDVAEVMSWVLRR